ncbi:MepB family protein [Microbacterium sp. NPDC055312]
MTFTALKRYATTLAVAVFVTPELQNTDYESGLARIGDEVWHVRTARTTPKKPGAFLAFWQRDPDGRTAPFGDDDVAAGLLVFVQHESRNGVFRFSAAHLRELGITAGRRPGKRGFRVYPSWSSDLNVQAMAAQRAQASAFHEYHPQSRPE